MRLVQRDELVSYCDRLLEAGNFRDYCPNGLQVEGCGEVARIVSGVTASQALIEAAVAQQADLVLVHHGYFWKGEDARLTGIKRRRIKSLLDHDINLLAYHLPLDAHPELGNNVCLGKRLELEIHSWFGDGHGPDLACEATSASPLSAASLGERISQALGRKPQHIDAGPAEIRRIGWCSGAAQSYLEAAARRGLDAFISGEISEPTVHIAREYGIHYFAAGHHASERYGVQALGARLAAHFGIEHFFIDIDNPV
ncbi:GTP cyclohydrolase 1 type 2 homolog YbgI [hydrothermal vent metagenome]|uniref:GTP cyclohydrolase 1 type 2 homolog YbgI n=1 Tax=hydrothermal vent metagenome TaxID=652676 RepID=A0A3B0ZGS0_9ZZZZ